jgi:hypothetical protein
LIFIQQDMGLQIWVVIAFAFFSPVFQ